MNSKQKHRAETDKEERRDLRTSLGCEPMLQTNLEPLECRTSCSQKMPKWSGRKKTKNALDSRAAKYYFHAKVLLSDMERIFFVFIKWLAIGVRAWPRAGEKTVHIVTLVGTVNFCLCEFCLVHFRPRSPWNIAARMFYRLFSRQYATMSF